MEDQEWTALPIAGFRACIMLGYFAAAAVLLVESVLWLLHQSPLWSPNAPPFVVGAITGFSLVTIPFAVWRLIHSATSIRLAGDSIEVGIAFLYHRTIRRQDVLSVRCHQPIYNEPDCRVVYAGGYFDVFLPKDERREDLAKRLVELAPQSSA